MNFSHGPSEPNGGAIDILNDAQVKYWTLHFSITETDLRNAVFIAGPLVTEVRTYLTVKGKIGR